MIRLKVVTVVGTRPEIIRLSSVIEALENSSSIEHILIHTGQNYDYELNEIFFEDLRLSRPDFFLEAAGQSPIETIGSMLIKIDPILAEIAPDALLVLGDTNSCLCAIAAKKRKIPIFHMEAGNRCFDQRVPEETNRKIVDHISDINLTYSSIAREYLLREGIPADRVIKTGSPMYEVIQKMLPHVDTSEVLQKHNLVPGNYFVVSAHREENVSSFGNLKTLVESLNTIAEEYEIPLIMTTHPRTRKMLEQYKIHINSNIKLIKPLGYIDYLKLQIEARTVLSDSGTISEESSILGFRALNIREAHERPEAMEEAAVIMTGLNSMRIMQGLKEIDCQTKGSRKIVSDYSAPNVSGKVVRIILSYVDYVNSNVWKKNC